LDALPCALLEAVAKYFPNRHILLRIGDEDSCGDLKLARMNKLFELMHLTAGPGTKIQFESDDLTDEEFDDLKILIFLLAEDKTGEKGHLPRHDNEKLSRAALIKILRNTLRESHEYIFRLESGA
jgi:hypothetical protein